MKPFRKLLIPIFTILMLFPFRGTSQSAAPSDTQVDTQQSKGNIYLYGEHHAVEKILKKEIEIWQDYYHNRGLRHLFLETQLKPSSGLKANKLPLRIQFIFCWHFESKSRKA